jgi:hypothetical protein
VPANKGRFSKRRKIAVRVCLTLFGVVIMEQPLFNGRLSNSFFNKSPEGSAYFRQVCDATKFMLDNDLRVTLNTDDPEIFNLNCLSDIYWSAQEYLGLTKTEITQLAKNSFEILWVDRQKKPVT